MMDRPLPSDTTAPHSRNVLTMQKKIGMWGGEGVHDKRYRYRYGHACEFTSALERPSLAGAFRQRDMCACGPQIVGVEKKELKINKKLMYDAVRRSGRPENQYPQ